ncbi:hypothetical protein B0J18DRAFT_437244 [Chaetomium sp. MPI-SDFR-AT-0129]|nr:hypothetical protein B0J18DRAFT_437244 [Chaetomium sp. MPI-SDFR-AT-0129]
MGQTQEQQQQQQQAPVVEQAIEPQQQEQPQQPPAVEPEITPAPPAYSPRATDEVQDASQPAANRGPAPVQQIPATLDKPLPQPNMAATQQQQLHPVPGVTPFHQLGDQPQWVDCPFCRTRALTRVQKEGSPMQV